MLQHPAPAPHDQARDRARQNRGGVGAAYIGRVAHDGEGWFGLVAVSDGDAVSEVVVTAHRIRSYEDPNRDALVEIVEGSLGDRTTGAGGPLAAILLEDAQIVRIFS